MKMKQAHYQKGIALVQAPESICIFLNFKILSFGFTVSYLWIDFFCKLNPLFVLGEEKIYIFAAMGNIQKI